MNFLPKNTFKTMLLGAAASALLAGTAAAEVKPAVVFDMGGKFDKSFNQGVYDGVEKFKSETGIEYREFEVTNEAQREQALRRMAQRGADPVLGIGFAQAPALEKVAKEFPDTRFAIIDMVVDLPNVRSIVFKEHEGSFLVGAQRNQRNRRFVRLQSTIIAQRGHYRSLFSHWIGP